MKLRISSLGPVALLASSMMLAFGAQAASADQGIVIYNAQHENLVKSWSTGLPKTPASRSRCATAATASWAISWCKKAALRLPTSS